MTDELDEGGPRSPAIDTTVPHSARIWNYWLGGKDNYPVDRQAGEQTIAVLPEIVDIARASRQFLVRVVRYLAGPAEIRQFLDVGTGLPTVNNTHEVDQQVASCGGGLSSAQYFDGCRDCYCAALPSVVEKPWERPAEQDFLINQAHGTNP